MTLLYLEQSDLENDSTKSGDEENDPLKTLKSKKKDEKETIPNEEGKDLNETDTLQIGKDAKKNDNKQKKNISAKTFVKYHKQNSNFYRLKELNRTYNQKPNKTLKAIIEKDLNLDKCQMKQIPAIQDLTHLFVTLNQKKEENHKIDQVDYQMENYNIKKYMNGSFF